MRHSVTRQLLFDVVAIALLMGPMAFGQSLGDIARENREKQSAEDASSSSVKPKVITNKDLPKDPNADVTPNGAPAVQGGKSSAVRSRIKPRLVDGAKKTHG